MQLRFAIAGGFLTKNDDGSYSAGPSTFGETAEAAKADEKIKEAADEAKDADKGDTGDGEALEAEIETQLDTLIAETSPDNQLACP